MIKASSSGDHLLCFLAGVSEGCGGILRFPPVPLGCGAADGGTLVVSAVGEIAATLLLVCCAADGEDSFESEARRRCEISTLTVLKVRAVKADDPATAVEVW